LYGKGIHARPTAPPCALCRCLCRAVPARHLSPPMLLPWRHNDAGTAARTGATTGADASRARSGAAGRLGASDARSHSSAMRAVSLLVPSSSSSASVAANAASLAAIARARTGATTGADASRARSGAAGRLGASDARSGARGGSRTSHSSAMRAVSLLVPSSSSSASVAANAASLAAHPLYPASGWSGRLPPRKQHWRRQMPSWNCSAPAAPERARLASAPVVAPVRAAVPASLLAALAGVARPVWELENGKLSFYLGGFDEYRAKKWELENAHSQRGGHGKWLAPFPCRCPALPPRPRGNRCPDGWSAHPLSGRL
jgi:hypothetical protein